MKENFGIIVVLVLMFASIGGKALELQNKQGQERHYNQIKHQSFKPNANHRDTPYWNYETIMTGQKGVFDLMEKYMEDDVAKKMLAEVP